MVLSFVRTLNFVKSCNLVLLTGKHSSTPRSVLTMVPQFSVLNLLLSGGSQKFFCFISFSQHTADMVG